MAFHYIRISAFLHNKIGFNTSLTSSLEIYLGWTQIYVYTSFKADLPTICWNGNTNFITIQTVLKTQAIWFEYNLPNSIRNQEVKRCVHIL